MSFSQISTDKFLVSLLNFNTNYANSKNFSLKFKVTVSQSHKIVYE